LVDRQNFVQLAIDPNRLPEKRWGSVMSIGGIRKLQFQRWLERFLDQTAFAAATDSSDDTQATQWEADRWNLEVSTANALQQDVATWLPALKAIGRSARRLAPQCPGRPGIA
jgi:hypothetical protein